MEREWCLATVLESEEYGEKTCGKLSENVLIKSVVQLLIFEEKIPKIEE